MFNFVHHVRILVHNADDMVTYLEQTFIGWEGELPLPSPHTTVRTGPYTAVHVDRCMARC